MLKLVILPALFSTFLSADSQQGSNKIFGGTNAKEGQFPYMVDLSVNNRGKFEHICGATLIHYNWIITAGHCANYVTKK